MDLRNELDACHCGPYSYEWLAVKGSKIGELERIMLRPQTPML